MKNQAGVRYVKSHDDWDKLGPGAYGALRVGH